MAKKTNKMNKNFKPKKILHILNCVGGVEVYVRQITANTNPQKVEHIIVSQPLKKKKGFFDSDNKQIKHYSIFIKREVNPLLDFFAIIQSIYIIYKERPDLIHAHSAKGGAIARISALLYNVKVFYTPHAFSFLSTNNKYKQKLYVFIEKLLKTKNTMLLATSNSEKKQAKSIIGFAESNTLVLTNATPPPQIIKLQPYKLTHSNYICTVGRPSYQKNIEMLLDVFIEVKKSHKKTHLYIIGAGEYSPNLNKVRQLISANNLENNVSIIPWVSRSNVLSILKNSKLYISTSRYEGMPYAVIESLSLKLPCVVTDVDGNRDLITNDYNGYIVQKTDVLDMSMKIKHLLKDNSKREQFGENAYKYYNKNHLLSSFIDKITTHYLEFSN